MGLAAAFRSCSAAATGAGVSDAALEAELAGLAARGRAQWPELLIDPEQFASDLGARGVPVEMLASLHAEDLHLAIACSRGVRGALEAFDAAFLQTSAFEAGLRRIDPSPAFTDEIRQMLRERLFVPAPGHIAEYRGRGSLAAWTGVAALRMALRLRPRRNSVAVGLEVRALEVDPELRFLQQNYSAQFEAALAASFARLDDEQRNLLRLQLVDGLGTGHIAALFGVDRSTIKRRLAACREQILEETHIALQHSLRLSPQSFASLARLLTSRLNLSLNGLLRPPD